MFDNSALLHRLHPIAGHRSETAILYVKAETKIGLAFQQVLSTIKLVR